MRALLMLSLLASVGLTRAAEAQGTSAFVRSVKMPRTVAFKLYKTQMLQLRSEALAQQTADGGTLSTDHRDAIQRRINHIEHAYHTRLEDGYSRH